MKFRSSSRLVPILAAATLIVPVATATAQNGRPAPQAPRSSAQPASAGPQAGPQAGRPQASNRPQASRRGDADFEHPNGGAAAASKPEPPAREMGSSGRRKIDDELVNLTFNETPVDEIFLFVAKMTGKVVIPIKPGNIRTQKITLVHEDPIPKSAAIDLVFNALRHNGIGIVETGERILIGQIEEILTVGEMPVLGPEVDVRYRSDLGNFVVKIFRLEKAPAETVSETLEEHVPTYASLTPDENSNQLVLIGDIALAQHLQEMIDRLDNKYITVKTQTYRLQYADAYEIADNIFELFEEDSTTTGSRGRSSAAASRRNARDPRRGAAAAASGSSAQATGQPGPVAEMRLTVNQQQNTVTVQADPGVIKEIDKLIYEEWDLPRPEGTSKTYTLRYTDPIKVRDMLEELLEQGGGGGRARSAARGAAGGGGGGSRTGVQDSLSGIYQIEAYPDSGSLVVLCKTEESFAFLDSIVQSVDQPSSVGLPVIIELKHAEAVSLADEMNVLLSEAGSNIALQRPDQGLSASGIGSGDEAGGGGASGGAAGGREAEDGGEIRFPWMAGGRQRDDQAPESSLIGKIRIVPIIRQNALAVLAPPQYQESVRELVYYLDRPGRQVMISAVIAEVELTDDLALGLRVSGTDIPLTKIDNSLVGGVNNTNSEENFFNIFDTSVLDLNFSANVILQALAEETNVRVLQEPRVFTADNQEAVFFDGQDIPFVTDSFTNNTGGLTQGFEYRQVGVVLNVRPRITAEKDVDMEVYLELSSIVPGQTLFGGFIVDRRSTTSQIVVKDGQTIVVSGILRDQESEIKRKVPFIGDLPLIGGLFQSTEKNKSTTELIAFITPIVVDNPTENDHNFNVNYRESLERLRQPFRDLDLEQRREEIREKISDPGRMSPMSMPDDGDLIDPDRLENARPARLIDGE